MVPSSIENSGEIMFANTGAGASSQCKFGLPTLDEALGGGLPRGTTWLVEDEIGSDADPFIMAFLASFC